MFVVVVVKIESIKLLNWINCFWSSINSMLFIHTKLTRNTKKKTSTFWLFRKWNWKKKENASILDEKERNRWFLKMDDFENKLSLKLKNRDLKFANVIRKTTIFLSNRWIISRNAIRFNNYSIEYDDKKKRVIFNLSFVVVDFNRCKTKSICNYLLYCCFAILDKQFQIKIIWRV